MLMSVTIATTER